MNMSDDDNQLPAFISEMKNHPESIAHRGGNGEWPGETIGAYEHARSLGVDVIEMDIYLTGDQQLVLMHDRLVNKTTDGTGPVESYTCAEIQKLNAGFKWTGEAGFPHESHLTDLSPELQRKLRVPRLSEVLEEFGDMRMVIEMKPAFASPAANLWEMLQHYNVTDKVLVASFSDDFIDEFRDLSQGRVATSASFEEFGEFVLGFHGLENHPVKPCVIDAPYWLLTEHLVNKIKDHGYMVHAWTVNDAEEMARMRDLGVDGIITDYPTLLRDVLGRTPPTP
jgi:glycerophosphoryl diester phosphodiesterase